MFAFRTSLVFAVLSVSGSRAVVRALTRLFYCLVERSPLLISSLFAALPPPLRPRTPTAPWNVLQPSASDLRAYLCLRRRWRVRNRVYLPCGYFYPRHRVTPRPPMVPSRWNHRFIRVSKSTFVFYFCGLWFGFSSLFKYKAVLRWLRPKKKTSVPTIIYHLNPKNRII